jgi:5-methylcytosine-specific restriction endonuclease McrA
MVEQWIEPIPRLTQARSEQPPHFLCMEQEQRKAWKDRGSAHSRGYGHAWRKRRAAVLVRDLGLCQPCLRAGRTTVAVAVDHVLNKARGGTDSTDNLQSICDACHAEKTMEEARHSTLPPQVGLDGWPVEEIPTKSTK